jgi:hypothetical protein
LLDNVGDQGIEFTDMHMAIDVGIKLISMASESLRRQAVLPGPRTAGPKLDIVEIHGRLPKDFGG